MFEITGAAASAEQVVKAWAEDGGTFRLIGIGHGGFEQSSIMVELYQPDFTKPATMAGRYLQLSSVERLTAVIPTAISRKTG